MSRGARPAGMVLAALATAVLLAVTSTVQAASTFAAATYLLKGTQANGSITSDQQVIDLATPWIIGATGAAPPQPIMVVDYPASLWPVSVGGFSDPTFDQSVAAGLAALPSPRNVGPDTIFAGGSQGAVVVSLYKREFNQARAKHPQKAPDIIFGLIANPMRPNGGIFERFAPLVRTIPILDITFSGASPTQTAGAGAGRITTFDIARQYDGLADFPTNPLFVLSDINAVMGALLVHPDVATVGMQDAVLQDEYGDTRYYLVPTYPVPVLMPLQLIPVVGPVLADMLDPAVRLLVEEGYDRTVSPGQPTAANYLYFPNPIALPANLLIAIPTGLDNGLQDILGVRPLATPRPDVTGQGAYGINAPPVTINATTNEQHTGVPSVPTPLTTENPTAASNPAPLAAERVPALKHGTQPADNQPLSELSVDIGDPPTTPTETEATKTTAPTAVVTTPVPAKIRGPIGADVSLDEHTPPSPSVFNKPSTRTTTATTGDGTRIGHGNPSHDGSPGASNPGSSRSASR